MAQVVPGDKEQQPFASQETSLRSYVEGLKRLPQYRGKTDEELLSIAYSAYELDPLTAQNYGITPETTLLPPEQRSEREAFQGTIPQQLGEAALDVAEIPVSITGYAGGIGAGLAEHIGDVAIAAPYTALTDTPTPSGMAGMRQLWTGEVGRLKEARDKYDQAFRVPIIELLVQSGVPQEEIDHLLQLDNAWLRKAKPRAPNEYRGLLSDGKFAHDFDIYNSPLFSRVNDILVGGGSSLKSAIDPASWSDGVSSLEGLHSLRSEYEYGPQNRVLKQIQAIDQQVQQISMDDTSFFTALSHDWDEIRNSTVYLLSDLMGATDFQPHYRHLAAQGGAQRLWARFQQSFEGGQEFAAGIPAGYAALMKNDLEMARNKPLLTFMLALPVLKAAGNSPKAIQMRKDLSSWSRKQVDLLREQASKDPRLASVIEKADSYWNKEIEGGVFAERIVKGDVPEQATNFEGRRPYTVGDVATATAKGAMHGAVMGVPEIGGAIGGIGSLLKARYNFNQVPGVDTQRRQTAGVVAEEGRRVEDLTNTLTEELERRRQGIREDQVEYYPEADLGTETVSGEIVLGSDKATFTPEFGRVRDLEAVPEAPKPAAEGRLGREVDVIKPPESVKDIPVLTEAAALERLEGFRGSAREVIRQDLNNLLDQVEGDYEMGRNQAIVEIAKWEIPDSQLSGKISEKALQYIPDAKIAELLGTKKSHGFIRDTLMDYLSPEEMLDIVTELRMENIFEPNFRSGLEPFINKEGVLDFREGSYSKAARILEPALQEAAAELKIGPRELLRDLRYDGSVISDSRLGSYLEGGFKALREWELPPSKKDLRPDPRSPGTPIEPLPTGKETRRQSPQEPDRIPTPLERGTETERAYRRQKAAIDKHGATRDAPFRQPFTPAEIKDVSFNRSKTVRSQAEAGLRRAARTEDADVVDVRGEPVKKRSMAPEQILKELDQLEANDAAEYRVVHVKKKTTIKGGGINGADVTLDRGYVVYDAKTNSLVPNVLDNKRAVIRSVGKPKDYRGTGYEYAAGQFVRTLKKRQRDVKRAAVEKTEAGTRKVDRSSPPPKGGEKTKKTRAQQKAERKAAEREKKLDAMNEVERAVFLAEEDAQARVKAGEKLDARRSNVGGFENPGKRSATQPPPKSKKGKKPKKRRRDVKWTTGDSEYSWNRRRSAGASGRAKALADYEALQDKAWMETRNHQHSTPKEARALKQAIIDQVRALDRRTKDGAQYGEAVKGYAELIKDTREAINDSLTARFRKKKEQKLDIEGAEQTGVKPLTETSLEIGTRMAKVLTLNDLVGLEQMLVKQRNSLVGQGTRSGKANVYSKAAAKIKASKLWMKVKKAPLDVLNTLHKHPKGKNALEREVFSYLVDKLRKEKRFSHQAELIKKEALGRSIVSKEVARQTLKEEMGHFGGKPGHSEHVKSHGRPLTRAEVSAKLRKMQEEYLGEEPPTLADIHAEYSRLFKPEPEGTLDLQRTPPGSESVITPDGPMTTNANTSGGLTVSRFVKSEMAKLSRRLVRKAGFMKGSKTVLAEAVRSIFESGTALLMSPTLRGIAKQETMKRLRRTLDERKETYDKGDLVKIESALDQYFEQFNRPFYAEGDAGVVTATMARVPDYLRIKIREGDGIRLDMADIFDAAINTAKSTKSKDLSVHAIQQESVAVMTKMLSNDARKNAHFKALADEATRLNISGDLLEAVADTVQNRETPAGKIAYNSALTELGRTLVSGIFGEYNNPANGLGLAPSITKDMTAIIRGTSVKEVTKWINDLRREQGLALLTAKERARVLGDADATRIASNTDLGRILDFYDSFHEIGLSPKTLIPKEFSKIFGGKNKEARTNEKTVRELNMVEEELFGPNTMYRDRGQLKYQKDFSVSPEWNEGIWWESANRMGMSELMTIWGTNRSPVKDFFLRLHRVTKGVMTTLNPTTHTGNKVSNTIVVTLMTGENPLAVERRITATAWTYLNYIKSKKTFGREPVGARPSIKGLKPVEGEQSLKEFKAANPELTRVFDVLHRQGLEMGTFVYEELRLRAEAMGDKKLANRIKEEFGELGLSPDRTPSLGRSGAKLGKDVSSSLFSFFFSEKGAFRRNAMKLYNFEDVSYRIGEFVREFSELESVVGMMGNNSDILIQNGANSYIKIFKDKNGRLYRYKNNKKSFMDAVEFEDLVGRSAMWKVNQVIFNYADIPKFIRFLRDIPFSPVVSPFITWAWKALDIPGAKRGLMANTLFEKPPFLSNDPNVLAYANRSAFKRSLRRSMLVSGIVSEMNELDNALAQHGRYSKELGGYGASILQATHRQGVMRASSTRAMDPFNKSISALKIMSTAPTATAQWLSDSIPFMTFMAPKYYTKEEMKGLGPYDKHVATLRRAYLTGNGLKRRELLDLFFLSETPALSLANALLTGRSPYHDGDATTGDVVRLISQMMVGEALYRLFGGALTMALNPELNDELMNKLYPYPDRLVRVREGAYEAAPVRQQTDIHPRAEAVANSFIMFLEYLTNLGSRELDFGKRSDTMLTDLRKQSQDKWIKPLEKQASRQTGDDRQWTLDRIREIQDVMDEWFQYRADELRRTHMGAVHRYLGKTKAESTKARLTGGVGSVER